MSLSQPETGYKAEQQTWEDAWETDRALGKVFFNYDLREQILQVLGDRPARILEVGGGSGGDASTLARLGHEAYLIDFSFQAIQIAKRASQQLEAPLKLVQADGFALPFKDETFDLIYHQGVFEHFTDGLPLLHEQKRALKVGGCLIIDVPQLFCPEVIVRRLKIRFNKLRYGWERQFSAGQLRSAVSPLNMEVVRLYGRNRLLKSFHNRGGAWRRFGLAMKRSIEGSPLLNNMHLYVVRDLGIVLRKTIADGEDRELS